MKNFTLFLLLGLLSVTAAAQKSKKDGPLVTPAVTDVLRAADASVIRGYMGGRMDAAYRNRILAQDADRLVAPFRNRTETSCWQSEFWGKWITSAILAYSYRPEPQLKAVLDKAVAGLIATQTSDGYIGNYADGSHLKSWDIWGRKYCMLGLLAYYDITRNRDALLAARKVADHLMKELEDQSALIVTKGNHKGMAASSILEPICQLYTRTGDKKYLGFAEEIVRQWETPEGPQLISKSAVDVSARFPKPKNWYGPDQGSKAYEMMSCYEGLLELYRLTGNASYLEAVENTWQNIREKEINIAGSGSAMEAWFGGKELQAHAILHYQETCVTATWIKLNQQLLRLTGEPKYADAIEQSFYNALLGAMKTDGSDWAKYTPLSGQRMEGSEQCGMGLNCCVASGPRGLFTFPLTAVMQAKNGVQVNFFADGSYAMLSPSRQKLEIIQETDYPVSGKVSLKILAGKPEEFSLRIRIPEWSRENMLKVNGETVNDLTPGQCAVIQRKWNNGDIVKLDLDMRGRVVRLGKLPENIAIVRGPIVLARDARLGGPAIESILAPMADKNGYLKLEAAGTDVQGMRMLFKASFKPESYREEASQPVSVTLCDYASAGNTNDEHSHFKTWLPQLIDPVKMP